MLYILIIILLVITFKYCSDLKKYSKESIIYRKSELTPLEYNLQPYIYSHNLPTISLDDICEQLSNKYYIYGKELIRISDFKNNSCYICKNNELIDDLQLRLTMNNIFQNFRKNISCNIQYYMSIIKGNYYTELTKNKHNIMIISILFGSCKLYLFNPKHENDILYKDLDSIKKWGIELNVDKSTIIYIPSNWYFSIDVSEICGIGHIEADNYFTFIYNIIK